MSRTPVTRVLLIGCDAADWKVINPLLDAGKMPNLERVVNNGVLGNLATLHPDLSPMLWTSIATGKRPFKHGIYGFSEPDPHTGYIRPITNVSRRTKAVWNILSQVGRKCAVIGWWPSHPAEPINGVMVSNHYQRAAGPVDKPWPMRPGTVHPTRIVKNLAALRWHPQHLEAGHILPFVPELARVDQDKDQRLGSLAKIICETCTIRDASLAILEHEPWDFAAVYFDGIDHFSHAFMRYHPPRLDWVPEEDYEIYRHVVEGGYCLHDIILGQLLECTDRETTVILVSDHGFRSDNLRPRQVPREPAGPAVQHRHYGIFAMMGPGIKRDDRIYGANLLDVCPTILTLFGQPAGLDMDGKTLTDAFESPPRVWTIPSWDEVSGPAGMHPPGKRIDPVEAREAINQLVALGYIEKPDENREKAVANTVRELDYNLARAYMDAGRHVDAAGLLEDLLERWPDQYRFGIQLVTCYQALERIRDARGLLEELFERKQKNAAQARERLGEWSGRHEGQKFEDLSEAEQLELRDLQAEATVNRFSMEYLMGTLLLAEGEEQRALGHLQRAEKADGSQPGLYLKIGGAHLGLKRWEEAERSFRRALDLDPDSADAHLGLGQCFLGTRRNTDAAEACTKAVSLLFHNPRGHFLLGVAMHRLGEVERAIQALTVAISQNPNFPEAHRRLAYIYKWRIHDHLKAAEHRMLARRASGRIRTLKAAAVPPVPPGRGEKRVPEGAPESNKSPQTGHLPPVPSTRADPAETITTVSGLPRSGTSMMMQMLRAGGFPVLADGLRKEDEDNPRGYCEYEKAKRLREDTSWLPGAKGKAVKVIAQLLPCLPPQHSYRVLFMERDIREILMSQKKMMERTGTKGARLSDASLAGVFHGQVSSARELLQAGNIPVLYVRYSDVIARPRETAARVNAFLGGNLDEAAMAEAVSPGLYRQRADRDKD